MGEAARTKITFLCRQDFANVSTEIAHAIRQTTTTHDAQVISMGPHPFNYALPHDCDLTLASNASIHTASTFLAESETVVWAEEANSFADPFSAYGRGNLLGTLLTEASANKRRRVVFHAGIAYRGDYAQYNKHDLTAFDGQLCSPDLLRFGVANSARAIWAKPMTTDLEAVDHLWKARREYGKIVITHSPSNQYKGTPMIRRVMERVTKARPNVEYRELGGVAGQHVAHETLMRSRDAAVLHIDQYHAGIGGVGIASFEAMTRGILPMASTNHIGEMAYRQWGFNRGSFPIVPLVFDKQEKANEKQTERALVHILSELGAMSIEKLEARGRAAAKWAHENLSYAAYARNWLAQLDEVTKKTKRLAA